MNTNDTTEAILRERFGHAGYRAGQREVVDGLLNGRSMLAVFPTGGGKSICYQLPATMIEGVTLVISPLIALMKDQVDGLRAQGVAAARLDSSLSQEDYLAVMDELARGELKLLYVAPERLANEGFRQKLQRLNLGMVAIDEAHCISEWGHNFRPDYLKLAKFCRDLQVPRVLGLTATATPAVAADVRREFGIAEADHIQLSFHRENLQVRVTPVASAQRDRVLLERLGEVAGAAIVYVTRQQTAEAVATYLNRHGVDAQAYHAGLPDEFRVEAQEKFMTGRTRVMVATIAFGMGIDKADIRAVFHYNLPKSLENYVQEIGRAGRDGEVSVCEMLACGDDLVTLENFIFGDTPTSAGVRHLVDHVLRCGREFDVSVYELSGVNDIRPLVVTTLLTYLELEGMIAATRPFYTRYTVQLLRDFERVLHGYDARRKAFLRQLFAAGHHGPKWIRFEMDEVERELGGERERAVAALTYLEESGDLIMKKSGVRQGYRLLQEDVDVRAVAANLDARFRQREESDLQRLRQVVDFSEAEGCLTARLVGHFGEDLGGECGHCARCAGEAARPLPYGDPREVSQDELAAIQGVRGEGHACLQSARQLTRFLCGISSPAVQRARLSRHDAFGLLEGVPFARVLELCESFV